MSRRQISPFGFRISADSDGLVGVGFLDRPAPSIDSEALELIRRRSKRDGTLGHLSGRWRIGSPDPAVFVPGDVPMVRALAIANRLEAHVELFQLLESMERLQIDDLGNDIDPVQLRRSVDAWAHNAARVQSAAPYFVPASTAMALLESEPPDDEVLANLRLPFPAVLVLFERELSFAAVDLVDDLVFEVDANQVMMELDRSQQDPTLLSSIIERGGALSGVVFLAGADGVGIDDEVIWLFSGEPELENPFDRPRDAYSGLLSLATLAPAIAKLAAAVAWATWAEPIGGLDLPSDPGTKEWKTATNKGRFRRLEPRGAAAGVRVLDVNRTVSASRGEAESAGGSSVTGHLRRGHWRRVRVGPRDSWHYEGRWIAPVPVNPDRFDENEVTVYRLPTL